MIICTDSLIREFWEKEIKPKYPNLDYNTTEQLCKSVFQHIRDEMKKDSFPQINVKFLGKFIPFTQSVRARLKSLEKRFESKEITEEQYKERSKNLIEFLNNKQSDGEEL